MEDFNEQEDQQLLSGIHSDVAQNGFFNHQATAVPTEEKREVKVARQPIQPKKSNYSCLKMIP